MTSQKPGIRAVTIIALVLSWPFVGQVAGKERYERHTWQDGKFVDTDEGHYLALIFGSSSTRGSIHVRPSTPGYGTDV